MFFFINVDLGVLGDTCSIAVTKAGIKFSSSGKILFKDGQFSMANISPHEE